MPRGAYTAKQERKADISRKVTKSAAFRKEKQRARLADGQQAGPWRQERRPGRKQPQRSRQEGLGNTRARRRLTTRSRFQDFDRTLDRAEFTMRQAFQPSRDRIRSAIGKPSRPCGQPQCKAAPVIGVLRALHKAGADQRVDCAADSRSTPLHRPATSLSVAGSLDRPRQQLAARTLGTLGRPVRHPVLRQGVEPRRKRPGR